MGNKLCLIGVVWLLWGSGVWAGEAQLSKGDAILHEVDKKLSPGSYESLRKLINEEPDGKKKEFVMWTAKQGTDKMVTTFLSPASEVGRSTLRVGENMWLYVPNVGKPVRITSLQSVVGGVFNNADIMQLEYATEYQCSTLTEEPERFVLTLKAKTKSVAYDRLIMNVNKKTGFPEEIECRAASGMLIKTLRFKEPKKFADGQARPAVIETDSPLYKGYKSVMIYAQLKRREFKDEVFTINYMSKIKELRE
jgi:outer membrane lipoprotein-sorting protein